MQQQWMKLAVFYWMDPKFSGLGPMHEALYTRLLGYTVAHSTAGFIPANAIALCGRRMRNRDRLIADLVEAGLLITTGDHKVPLRYPSVWHQWQHQGHVKVDHKDKETPGQRPALARTHEEKRREDTSNIQLEDSLAPVTEVVDPKLRAVLDRLTRMNGSG